MLVMRVLGGLITAAVVMLGPHLAEVRSTSTAESIREATTSSGSMLSTRSGESDLASTDTASTGTASTGTASTNTASTNTASTGTASTNTASTNTASTNTASMPLTASDSSVGALYRSPSLASEALAGRDSFRDSEILFSACLWLLIAAVLTATGVVMLGVWRRAPASGFCAAPSLVHLPCPCRRSPALQQLGISRI